MARKKQISIADHANDVGENVASRKFRITIEGFPATPIIEATDEADAYRRFTQMCEGFQTERPYQVEPI